jgi:predicted LPLAT superfamily acyltransferase
MTNVSLSPTRPRNPGPSWGYWFLQHADRWLPRWLFRPALMLGTWVALPFMGPQRHHSREYLALVLGRSPRLLEVWRHFFAFADFLMLMLRVGRGLPQRCRLAPRHGPEFDQLVRSDQPALFGTFHFGHSDLLGYLLSDFNRRVAIIRQRVANSDDTRWLGRHFEKWVSFIWVNDPASLLFAIRDAVEGGQSLAMKCDRLEFSGKTESFDFLGRRRLFPFTIYHLAILFGRPVVFCVGVPESDGATLVVPSPIFHPDPADRDASLQRARAHFQAVLAQLETLVRQHPLLWFNFLPLNPEPGPPRPANPS